MGWGRQTARTIEACLLAGESEGGHWNLSPIRQPLYFGAVFILSQGDSAPGLHSIAVGGGMGKNLLEMNRLGSGHCTSEVLAPKPSEILGMGGWVALWGAQKMNWGLHIL